MTRIVQATSKACPCRREVHKMYFQNVCIKIEKENTEITNGANIVYEDIFWKVS
jgi:hypothetical protein